MLDRLPTELVEAIFEHLAPPLVGIWETPLQPDDLKSVVCVSKRLYLIANPFFWRTARVDLAIQADKLLALLHEPSAHGIKQLVKTLQVPRPLDFWRFKAPTMTDIRALLALLPQVKRFEITAEASECEMQWCTSSDFGLEAMWLHGMTSIDPLPATRLTVLTELSLDTVTVTRWTFLTPENFPALRALSLFKIITPRTSLSDGMLDQLDLVQLSLSKGNLSHSSHPARLLQSIATPVVLTMRRADQAARVPKLAARHLAYFVRLRLNGGYTFARLFTPSYQPHTLHLFAPFQPDQLSMQRSTSAEDAAMLEDVEATLKICNECGVEVVWHEEDDSRVGSVSPSLWRWAKKVKADRRVGGSA